MTDKRTLYHTTELESCGLDAEAIEAIGKKQNLIQFSFTLGPDFSSKNEMTQRELISLLRTRGEGMKEHWIGQFFLDLAQRKEMDGKHSADETVFLNSAASLTGRINCEGCYCENDGLWCKCIDDDGEPYTGYCGKC